MSLSQTVSAYNRERKWQRFVTEFAPSTAMRVLDVGFSDREYSPVDNFLEKRYPWPSQITALGIDTPMQFPERYPLVTVRQYSGGRMPFRDREFDVAWSNAVLEHVGNHDAQVAFVREMSRVSDAIFLSTPNRFFPVETHTRLVLVHWLPNSAFDRVLRAVGMDWAAGSYMNLMGRAALARVLKDAGVCARIISNRIGPLALDFVAVGRRDPNGLWRQ